MRLDKLSTMMKLTELADNYVNGALHSFLTMKEKNEIVNAAKKNQAFLSTQLISKEDAKDRRTVAFMVLSAAREVLRLQPSN